MEVPETAETDGGSPTEVMEEKPGGIGGFFKGIFGGGKKEVSSESTPAPSEEPGSGETGIENSQEVDVPRPETDGGSAAEVVEEKPGGIGGFLKEYSEAERKKLGVNPCPIRGPEAKKQASKIVRKWMCQRPPKPTEVVLQK